MANHAQAIKRHRQLLVRTERNRYYKARLRTFLKRSRLAIANGSEEASALVKQCISWIDHSAVKGAIPKQRAARIKSRLMAQLAKK